MGVTAVAPPKKAKAKPKTRTTTAVAELRARVERVENENVVLKSALSDVARRLEQLEAGKRAELEDYERREAALYEFANSLGVPPESDTDDPWEIARREGERLGIDKMRELFAEE